MSPDRSSLPTMAHGRGGVDSLWLLRRRWRMLAVMGLLGLAAGVSYYLLSTKWYQSEIMIVPKEDATGGLGSAGALLRDLPFDVGGGSSLGNSDAERIAAVLKSRSTTDAVIQKFGLIERYETGNIETTRKQLWSVCSATVEKKPNVVVLACEDTEPEVARDMAEYFGQVGDEGFRRIAISSASEERKFLEQRAGEARADLDRASRALREFQEKHKIIDLPEQSKAVVSSIAAIEGDLLSKRIQLSYLRGFTAGNESSTGQLTRQIEILRKELRTLEQMSPPAGTSGQREGSDLFPPAMDVPALRYELEGLYRDQKVRETVYMLLTERFESLKVDEARDLSTFVVFDHAALPTHRIRPRFRSVPIGAFLGLSFGVLLVLLPAWWRDLVRRSSIERAA